MPPRPFPFELSIGTDIIHIPRIQRLIDRAPIKAGATGAYARYSRLHAFLRRLLTDREQRCFRDRFKDQVSVASSDPCNPVAQYLAGRWAAKEAVIKAHKHCRLTFMNIEVLQFAQNGGRKGIFALIRDAPGSPVRAGKNATESGAEDSAFQYELQRDGSVSFPSDHQSSGLSGVGHTSIDFEDLEGQIAKVSISHDGNYATAVCLAAEQLVAGDIGGEVTARMP